MWAVIRSPCKNTIIYSSSIVAGIYVSLGLADGGIRTAGSDKHHQPQQYSANGFVAQARGVWAAALERWDLRMLSVVYLVYVLSPVLTARESPRSEENRQSSTDAYVQNKAYRTETREIVLFTPAGKTTLSACHALQSAQIAPRPRPMCPGGLPVSEYSVFCREVLEKSWQQHEKLKTYVYIQVGLASVDDDTVKHASLRKLQ